MGADLLALMDALGIQRACLAGYDWGGRAACIVASLWPERTRSLVSINGYNIQNLARAPEPAPPEAELRHWYIWYFQTERGRAALQRNRAGFCRLLWQLWSPNLAIADGAFARTAASWDNPDFVDVVIHSYRHRHNAAPGDPSLQPIEDRLAATPAITVPSIVLHGEADGVDPPASSQRAASHFTGPYQRRVIPVAGHFLPREAPGEIVRAILDLA